MNCSSDIWWIPATAAFICVWRRSNERISCEKGKQINPQNDWSTRVLITSWSKFIYILKRFSITKQKSPLTTGVFCFISLTPLGGIVDESDRRDQVLAAMLTVTLVVWLVPDLAPWFTVSSVWLVSTDVMLSLNNSDCTVDGGDMPRYSITRSLSRL